MQQEIYTSLGENLRILAIRTRDRLGLTQKEMGEKLHMSESSYSDIETGRSYCSMPTAMYLLDMQEDPGAFIHKSVKKATAQEEKELQPV